MATGDLKITWIILTQVSSTVQGFVGGRSFPIQYSILHSILIWRWGQLPSGYGQGTYQRWRPWRWLGWGTSSVRVPRCCATVESARSSPDYLVTCENTPMVLFNNTYQFCYFVRLYINKKQMTSCVVCSHELEILSFSDQGLENAKTLPCLQILVFLRLQ